MKLFSRQIFRIHFHLKLSQHSVFVSVFQRDVYALLLEAYYIDGLSDVYATCIQLVFRPACVAIFVVKSTMKNRLCENFKNEIFYWQKYPNLLQQSPSNSYAV